MALVYAVPVIWCPVHDLVTLASASVSTCPHCQSLAADLKRIVRHAHNRKLFTEAQSSKKPETER